MIVPQAKTTSTVILELCIVIIFCCFQSGIKMAPMPPHAAVKETGVKLEKTQELQKWLDENQYSR